MITGLKAIFSNQFCDCLHCCFGSYEIIKEKSTIAKYKVNGVAVLRLVTLGFNFVRQGHIAKRNLYVSREKLKNNSRQCTLSKDEKKLRKRNVTEESIARLPGMKIKL